MAAKNTTSKTAGTRIGGQTPFHILEAYKQVRANLLFSLAPRKSKAVVISSALPGEGKSVTCANLAITMSQTGAKVLLLDSDLRKPVQHKLFRLSNDKGLSSLLAGLDKLEDALHPDAEPHLDVITSGPLPPNPSELIGSDNMRSLLQTLTGRYDYILLDSPPVNVVSDAVVLSNIVSGVILVARQGHGSYHELAKAVKLIGFSDAAILGVVINAVKPDGKLGNYKKYGYYAKNRG